MFDQITVDAASVCVPIIDFLNVSTVQAASKDERLQQGFSNMTIEQMFQAMPSADRVIEACLMRNPSGTRDVLGRSVCNHKLTVSRYYTQQMMCYIIRERNISTIDGMTIDHSLHDTHLIMDVYFSKVFSPATAASAVLFDSSSRLPYTSRDTSRIISLFRDADRKERANNMFNMSPRKIHLNLLQSPYETACIERTLDVIHDCRRDCLVHLMQAIDRCPFSEMIEQPLSVKPISHRDLRDRETRYIIRSIEEDCSRKCNRRPCSSVLTGTDVSRQMVTSISMGLRVMTSRQLYVTSFTIPFMAPVEYFSFVTGCFGTWFGVSFVSLSSLRLLSRKHRTRMPRGQHGPRSKSRACLVQGFSPSLASTFLVSLRSLFLKHARLLIYVGAFIGCSYQSLEVSIAYFGYQTTNRLERQLFDHLHMSPMAACFRAIDFMPDISFDNADAFMEYIRVNREGFANYTVGQLLLGSPKESHLIQSCVPFPL